MAALPTAVGCSRMFTRITLKDWGLEAVADTAELLMSELVTNVVKITGVMEPSPKWTELTDLALLHARLVQLEDGLIIEVADPDSTLPTMPQQSLDTEGGRGLFLIESISKRWNAYPTDRGKVVWCELGLPGELTEHGLPRRKPSPTHRRPVEQGSCCS